MTDLKIQCMGVPESVGFVSTDIENYKGRCENSAEFWCPPGTGGWSSDYQDHSFDAGAFYCSECHARHEVWNKEVRESYPDVPVLSFVKM
jgi:hypothetical protein